MPPILPRSALALAGLLLATSATAASLTREFRFDPGQVSLRTVGGYTQVSVAGGIPERRPGFPDLPVVSERVDVPDGMRVAGVEVVALETTPMADHVSIAPALEYARRDGASRRTLPDAAAYASAAFQPETPVALGAQGCMRERTMAFLQVAPVRWNAADGRLERVTRVTVRLQLESTSAHALVRERVVPGRTATAAALVTGKAQPFRPTQLPSLLGSPVAYVIVTTDSLATAFQVLADWKTASGVPAVVRTLSFIRAQYPVAADDPERIRLFLRDAYTRWGTDWALLGGDTDVIPPRLAHIAFLEDEQLPSDLYYACLDGNWNADGDSTYGDGYNGPNSPGDNADLMPELWVGRAPVITALDAQRFVQKTLTYEKTPVSDYMDHMLFFAQVLEPQPWHSGDQVQFDGAELVEQDLLPILDQSPQMHYQRLYQNDTDSHWRPGALPETRAAVLDSLQRGYNIAVHIGHGFREVMACGDGNLTTNDVSALTNGNRLMNFYAIDCTSNAIDFSSIGEALMRAANGGAVTNIGSTSLDFPDVSRDYQKEYFRVLLRDSVNAVGEAQGRQKLPFLATSYYDFFDRQQQLTMLLLGDPELHIYLGTPRDLVVTAPSSMAADDSSISVHVTTGGLPLRNARVTAWMPNHEYRSGLTDAGGDLTLPFRPDSLGPVTLTVTAFDARPYQGSFNVVPGTPPALQALAPTVLDDSTGGRQGNGNGIPEAGEIVDLLVPVRNAGGSFAFGVDGTLATTDGFVSVTSPAVSYGAIAPGTTGTPPSGYRINIPYHCPDQREVAFTLDLTTSAAQHAQQAFRLTVRAPELVHVNHDESEDVGNHDGRPQPGETVVYAFRIRNAGTAAATGLTGVLRNADGLAPVSDSTFTLPDLAPGAEALGTPVRFAPSNSAARLQLVISDAGGVRSSATLDLGYPNPVVGLLSSGGVRRIKLAWARSPAADLAGYHVYRGTSAVGPFTKVTPGTAGRNPNWIDDGLPALTPYWYQITAVDSSGNESFPSATISATSNPPDHATFPAYTRESSSSPVAVERMLPGLTRQLLVGGDKLHLFRADGSAPVDADGLPATPGDLSTQGLYFNGGGSVSDLDGTGARQLIGAAWMSQQLLVFDTAGQMRAGFPKPIADQMWSGVAVGDLDGDGHREMVFATLGRTIDVFRANGNEWMDGDANPGTIGVFKVMNSNFNPGTPALADLLGNGQKDIVYGGFDGFLYAWKPDGSNVPGFPVNLGVSVTSSVAVGRLDGPGQPYSIVVPTADNKVRVVLASGALRPGFPVNIPTSGTNRTPSPAIADMNNDGFPDIVIASTDGRIAVYNRTGALLAPWTTSRFSALTATATEASPVVADINGDGLDDVVIGDENGSLAALSGASGAMLPGFPIQLEAEASGTPALCDCDNDGKSEIAVVDYGGTLHVWDYDFPFSPNGPAPWPQFHHDAERTGTSDTPPLPVGVPLPAGAHDRLALAPPFPNPARVAPELGFDVPAAGRGAEVDLSIYDLAGRRVRTLVHGAAQAGHTAARWDLRGARGTRVGAGVYLVRLRTGGQALKRKLVVIE